MQTERERDLEMVLEWEKLFTQFLAVGKEHGRVDALLEQTRHVLWRDYDSR